MKRYNRYLIDFSSKWATRCGSLMGISLFVRVVYFFGLMNVTQCGALQVICDMILAMGLTVVFLICLSALRRNAPGFYALIGCGFLLLLLLDAVASWSFLRILLALIGYGGAGAILIATVAGYLPNSLLSALTLALTGLVRFLAYDLGKLTLFDWVLELSWLLILASLFCLTLSLTPAKHR